VRFEVTDADTATALGSGDVPVLATPRLIAWMEAATVQSVARFVSGGADHGRYGGTDRAPPSGAGGR
jgi:predicted thioesterase